MDLRLGYLKEHSGADHIAMTALQATVGALIKGLNIGRAPIARQLLIGAAYISARIDVDAKEFAAFALLAITEARQMLAEQGKPRTDDGWG